MFLGLTRSQFVKAVALFVFVSLVYWNVEPLRFANAGNPTTDLPPSIAGNPSTYGNLINANGNLTSASGNLQTATSSFADTVKQFDALQSGLFFLAMDQGANGSGITFDRITNASAIVEKDALTLVSTSLAEMASAGIIVPQTLNSATLLSQQDTDILAEAALRDLGLDPEELKRGIAFTTSLYGDGGIAIVPMDMASVFDFYWDFLDQVGAAISSISGPVTLNSVKMAAAMGMQKVAYAYPNLCPVSPPPPSSPDASGVICPASLPPTATEISSWLNMNFDAAYTAVSNSALKNKLVADIRQTSGTFMLPEYKLVVASSLASVTGYTNTTAVMNAIGAKSAKAFETTVKNAIENSIMQRLSYAQNLLTPASIENAVKQSLANPANTATADLRNYIQQIVNGSISGGAVSLTQILKPQQISYADVQNIVDSALKDTSITGLSATQLQSLVNGTALQINLTQGKLDVAGLQNLVATEITKIVPSLSVSTLVPQLSAGGAMVKSFEGAISNAMVNNVMNQLGSATALLDQNNLQMVLANQVLSTTGLGNLANINTVINNLGALSLSQFQSKLQGIVSGQITQLTNQMQTLLSPANIEKTIASQMTQLTGLGNIASVESLINNSVGQALSSVTQIGAQLISIEKALTGSLASLQLSLNSLTGTFNNTLSSLTSLTQLNLSSLTGNLSGLVGNLTSQITGPVTSAVSSIAGPINNIISSGIATTPDLGSLTSSLGSLSGGLGSMLSSAGGISSLTSGVPGMSGMTEKPFGGKIVAVKYCTCSPGDTLITVGGIPGFGGVFYYKAGASVLYPMYQVYRRGPNVLGLASYATYPCMVYIGFSCKPSGAGMVITQIGTSR
jgi:hypothetical protein